MDSKNPLTHLSFHARRILQEAENIAKGAVSDSIEPKHLLLAIYFEKGSLGSAMLHDIGIGEEIVNEFFFENPEKSPSSKQDAPVLSEPLKRIIAKAYYFAHQLHSSYVGTEHFVQALSRAKDKDIDALFNAAQSKKKKNPARTPSKHTARFPFPEMAQFFSGMFPGAQNFQQQEEETESALDQFCIHLNRSAIEKNTDSVIGREAELERLIHILGRKNKSNAILIGHPGVGKTALVCELARRIEMGNIPAFLLGKSIYEIDMAAVVAGTTFRGEFEERLKDIMYETQNNPNIILFIDEIHTIVGAGSSSNGLDAANILKPALSKNEIRCIGATTFSEYKKHFEKDAALNRRFQPIMLSEPSEEETRQILLGIKGQLESFHAVSISEDVIDTAVRLSARHITDRFFPDKAIDLLDEAASAKKNSGRSDSAILKIRKFEQELFEISEMKKKLIAEEKYDQAQLLRHEEENTKQKVDLLRKQEEETRRKNISPISAADIARVISRIAKIPEEKILAERFERIRGLHDRLKEKISGQDESLATIADKLNIAYSGLQHTDRPIGSFLLLGPSGVGKTYTAKILARLLFDRHDALIHINMSEFRERHQLASLIGAPAGYIGYGEGGKLTERIRRNPHSIVLFDEVEKAHPDVLNILLQILEEGELLDSEGQKASFKESIIILTSNTGAFDAIAKSEKTFGFSELENDLQSKKFERAKAHILSELNNSIRPEILNRLDAVIVYRTLSEEDIKKIILSELENTRKKASGQGYTFTWDKNTVPALIKKSISSAQGARIIRNNIQTHVESKLANRIIHNTNRRQKTFRLSFSGEEFSVR